MHKRSRNGTGVVVLVIVVGLWALIWFQQRAVLDWVKLYHYTPPAAIAQLASDTTMTAKATHDYYVNHPDLEAAATFNVNCPAGSEQTIVLGCYHGNQQGIYLYDVTDSRLNGVEQVTAAHEMLHAAYDRLSTKDRNYVDGLLQDYYNNDVHDQRLLDTIAAYKKSEPNDVVNEMHSVFGTEVASLPPALENYYKQYFTDRPKIAAYAAAYQSEFISRQKQVTEDDTKLQQLKAEFTANEDNLQVRSSDLENLQTTMTSEKQSEQIDAYNANVPLYNGKVDAYNAEVTATKQLIADYNQLVVARNAIAVEEQQLEKALSSQLAPITTK